MRLDASLRAASRMVVFAAACAAASCGGGPAAAPTSLVSATRVAMGSELRVSVWTRDQPSARRTIDAVFVEFDHLEALLTVWREDSDIQRLNAAAGDHAVAIGPDTLDVLRAARQVSDWTGGRFDVTWAALSGLWKFDQDQDNRVPAAGDIQKLLGLVDYRDLVLDESARTAYLRRRGMRVNVGGIGKGFAIEHAVRILRGRGFTDFLVQAGGDMYVAGLKSGQPWQLGIADPRNAGGPPFATMALSDATFSTSGDYERSFVQNGRRYHHILDPRTGEPARGCRSVTIVTDSPTMADGLSTGVFVMGPEAGLALVERLPNTGAVIVTDRNEVLISSRLKDRVHLLARPTEGI